MTPREGLLTLGIIVVSGLLIWVLLFPSNSPDLLPSGTLPPSPIRKSKMVTPVNTAATPETTPSTPTKDDALPEISPLAARLNAPDGNVREDVRTLHELILQYLHTTHQARSIPIGNDSDLARAITGGNPLGVVLMRSPHPALSLDGRLRDRWGTPYFIHALGGNAFDVRSAGPDQKMFTADDVMVEP